MKTFTIRLKPAEDLLSSLESFVNKKEIEAGCILTCVGSLTTAVLRLANQGHLNTYEGHFEIVSLVGTISVNGSHLHISISDEQGKTTGGHLWEGCKIYTTAEIVIADFDELSYKREACDLSGYDELVVYNKK